MFLFKPSLRVKRFIYTAHEKETTILKFDPNKFHGW